MNSITADAALQASLAKLDQLTEIRDAQDHVIGFFAPANQLEELLYQQAAAHFDAEEMERRIASGKRGLTTREVLDRLASLGTSSCDIP